MSDIARKYALMKVSAGDYLLPSNDGQTIWRIETYEDGPSHGLDWPRDRTLWRLLVTTRLSPLRRGGGLRSHETTRTEGLVSAEEQEKGGLRPLGVRAEGSGEGYELREGDALDLIQAFGERIDLLVTDPPYAFGGSGGEHALSATVAIVLREAARKMAPGSWAVIFAASSWRSTAYMVEAVRGVLEPVRIGTWTKPESKTKVATSGWKWASVNVIALRKGKARETAVSDLLDHICAAPLKVQGSRRAELPPEVADWAVTPFAVPGGIALDPFAGSGALPLAAERAGMRACGFEKNPDQRMRLAA